MQCYHSNTASLFCISGAFFGEQVYGVVDEAAHKAAGGLPVVRVAQTLIKAPIEDVALCWWQAGRRKVGIAVGLLFFVFFVPRFNGDLFLSPSFSLSLSRIGRPQQ